MTSRIALSSAEQRLWQAWKRATDSVLSRVSRDIVEATGLSGADYDVLCRLMDRGSGSLRQQELADSMAWHKSRLSHHLSRMEARELVRRKQAQANNVLVVISAAGRRAHRAAIPVHVRAVRMHLLRQLPPSERSRLLALFNRLATA